ncbi:MAG: S8 family serine peptidase [Candidatus Izemoplasmatales bacterium]
MTKFIKKILIIILSVIFTFFFFAFTANEVIFYSSTSDIEFLSPPWKEVPSNDYTQAQYNLDLINVFEAWNIVTGSNDVTIAIIDSGIDTDHDEFTGRISNLSYNSATDQVGISEVEDDLGHGTNVAGIIAAERNNNLGIDGITDNVQLLIIKANNAGEETYANSNIVEGIYYAVDNGADIINLSLGSESNDPSISEAIDYAYENEVFVVAASGNDGTNVPIYPAALPNVISVGSIGENSTISDFSSFGESIDLVAPGELIYTTHLDNGYAQVSGTSFAAPHVAAVLALLLSNGIYSFPEVYEIIYQSAIDLGTIGKDIYYGYGLIDAYKTVISDLVQISFETFNSSSLDSIWVQANEPYIIEYESSLIDYAFIGWYLEDSYQNIVDNSYVYTDDLTLYAKFEPIFYTITFMVENEKYDELQIQSGSIIENLPIVDIEDKYFYGWYYSLLDNIKYNNQVIRQNTTLYAKINELMYLVTFLDENDSFYQEYYVYPSESIDTYPSLEDYSDSIFNYSFNGWDNSLENINSNLIIRPLFIKTFIFQNAYLNPGLDTLTQFEQWNNAGITLNNKLLSYEVEGTVDSDKVGHYLITYNIYYQDELVYYLSRVINVSNQIENVIITLNDGVDTIVKGASYIEVGATSNLGEVIVIGSVNNNEIGQYKITYQVEYNGIIHEKTRYVYVIDNNFIPLDDVLWYLESGDKDEEN